MQCGFQNIINWQQCSAPQRQQLLARPVEAAAKNITATVSDIIQQVLTKGDQALREFSAKFDRQVPNELVITHEQIQEVKHNLPEPMQQAIKRAAANIRKFHQAQLRDDVKVQTEAGIYCTQTTRAIQSVGLYIPGGTAPLPSTVLMLAIPAQVAGCQQIVLCSPPPISAEILFAADLCGVQKIYQIGGAQAIAAMAFGTESVTKVDKIFGPGNSFVTEAKQQVSQNFAGAAIDMPAGPSEVLVIADAQANAEFVAADLLSQAEHGADSQVILLTTSEQLAQQVIAATERQLARLERQQIASQALAHSRVIILPDLLSCVQVSNQYAPEHLILQTENADELVPLILHAGSVFVGAWSPESAGDYASGTNHVLPTYGYAKTYSSLGLADFQKRMTVQKLTASALQAIGPTIETIATAEQLTAHRNAVTVRLNYLANKE